MWLSGRGRVEVVGGLRAHPSLAGHAGLAIGFQLFGDSADSMAELCGCGSKLFETSEPMVKGAEILPFCFAESLPARLAYFDAQAADQKRAAEDGQHWSAAQSIAAGDQNEAEKQHDRAPGSVSRTAELNSEKGEQQQGEAEQQAEITTEGREHYSPDRHNPF